METHFKDYLQQMLCIGDIYNVNALNDKKHTKSIIMFKKFKFG